VEEIVDCHESNVRTARIVLVVSCLLVLLSIQTYAFSQDGLSVEAASREFLRPMEERKKNILMERHAYDLAILEYFAKPGTFDLYEFDIGVLEIEGATITITPKNIAPIEILSHGVDVNWLYGGQTARWTGEIPIPNSAQTFSIEIFLAIRSVDASAERGWPDPNREVTRAALEGDNYVVLEESKRRLSERIIYGLVAGFIPVPARRTAIRLSPLGDDLESFESVLVYEIDESKTVIPGDDSPVNPTPPTPDQIRRFQEFREHEARVRREFGMPPREAF